MPGRERSRLIQKEELAVPVRSEDLPPPVLEAEDARDPPPQPPWRDDLFSQVVQHAAISHPAPRDRVARTRAIGIHAILKRHGQS